MAGHYIDRDHSYRHPGYRSRGHPLEPQHLIFAYLIPTSFIAVRYGSALAVLTSVACSICGAFFLFPPKFSVYIAQPLHVAELGFFLLLAIATAQYINVLSAGERPRKPT